MAPAQKTAKRGGRRAGNAIIEFTLVGIPVLFVLMSIFEIARGMWVYDTLAHSVKDTVRFLVVHGENCSKNGNSCAITLNQLGKQIAYSSQGLNPSLFELELRDGCSPDVLYSGGGCQGLLTVTLQDLLDDTSGDTWPTFGAPQFEAIEVLGKYPFQTAFAVFWPAVGGTRSGGVFDLEAVSVEMMQF